MILMIGGIKYMKHTKKIFRLLFVVVICFMITGCGSKNIEGKLPDLMDKLYEGIKEEERPMALQTTELTEDNFKTFAFADVKYKEAVVSESMTGSIAHSVVLIRLEDAKDATKAVEDIKKNADPRKWICVEAENVYVLSKGDLVVLIMSNELAPKIKENFENLK